MKENLRRISARMLPLTVAAIIGVSVVWAVSVHNKKGPTCTDNGFTASCTGTLAGLGNFDILVKLSTSGVGTTLCTNKGGNQAPGQNPGIPIPNITGIQVIPSSN